MRLVDTHCHVDLEMFDDDRDRVFERAREAGVDRLLVIGFEPNRWRAALELDSSLIGIRVAAGIHPNSAGMFDCESLNQVRQATADPRVIAIGETGIDLYWDAEPLETQREAFAAQVSLAQELGLPFIVHQREAESEVLDILSTFPGPLHGVLHCFTGDWDYAKDVLEFGMHIGLGGAITFKSRTGLHDAARMMPLDRVVLETDSPYMTPAPHRGKRNEPANVRLVAERLAELRALPVEEVAEATTRNACELFPGLEEQA